MEDFGVREKELKGERERKKRVRKENEKGESGKITLKLGKMR